LGDPGKLLVKMTEKWKKHFKCRKNPGMIRKYPVKNAEKFRKRLKKLENSQYKGN